MATKRQVPAERYDRDYLLSENTEGFREFREGALSFIKQQQLQKLELTPGTRLLEVGFGGGEFLYHCARLGARVSGIDYSPAALEIGKETMVEFPDADLRVADCKALPFEDDSFERVYSGDVLEHQDIDDGVVMLREIRRVLEPGGFLFLHTAPNTETLHRRPGFWVSLPYDFHWHIEILPRLTRVAGFEWGTGFYINPTAPEDAARFLRDARIPPID